MEEGGQNDLNASFFVFPSGIIERKFVHIEKDHKPVFIVLVATVQADVGMSLHF